MDASARIRLQTIATGTAIIIILLTIFVLVPLMLHETQVAGEHHIKEYSVMISSSDPVENLTLLLPFPVSRESWQIRPDIMKSDAYGIPEGWDITVVTIGNTPMLKICNASLVSQQQQYLSSGLDETEPSVRQLPNGQVIQTIPLATRSVILSDTEIGSIRVVAQSYANSNNTSVIHNAPIMRPLVFGIREYSKNVIDTRDPFGGEPLLNHGESLQPEGSDLQRYPLSRSFSYTSPVYIYYSSDYPASVRIIVSIFGGNEWWDVVGWSSNSYTDTVSISCAGDEQRGWMNGRGLIQVGKGTY